LFVATASGQNIDELFYKDLDIAINDLLKNELTSFLNYEKYDSLGLILATQEIVIISAN